MEGKREWVSIWSLKSTFSSGLKNRKFLFPIFWLLLEMKFLLIFGHQRRYDSITWSLLIACKSDLHIAIAIYRFGRISAKLSSHTGCRSRSVKFSCGPIILPGEPDRIPTLGSFERSLTMDAVRKGKRRRERTVIQQEAHREGSSSVDVTPQRPHKRQRIRKRCRKPDPFQSSTTSQASSLSSLLSIQTEAQRSINARKQLKFNSSTEMVGVLII